MNRSEKKELGLLPRQIVRGVKRLITQDEIVEDMDVDEMVFVYLASVASDDEFSASWISVRGGTYAADWDAIIGFVTKIMELILRIMPLFV